MVRLGGLEPPTKSLGILHVYCHPLSRPVIPCTQVADSQRLPPSHRSGNTNTGSHLMTLLGNPHCGICAGRFHPPSPLSRRQGGCGIVAGAARASEAARAALAELVGQAAGHGLRLGGARLGGQALGVAERCGVVGQSPVSGSELPDRFERRRRRAAAGRRFRPRDSAVQPRHPPRGAQVWRKCSLSGGAYHCGR